MVDRADARTSEVFVVVLEPGEAPPLHQHNDTEQVFYILEGDGILRIGTGEEYAVHPTDVVRIPPSTLHSIKCFGEKPLRYLAIDCFLAGRTDAEPTWDAHAKVMCRNNGWDYGRVIDGE